MTKMTKACNKDYLLDEQAKIGKGFGFAGNIMLQPVVLLCVKCIYIIKIGSDTIISPYRFGYTLVCLCQQ